jgi:hypothetical protein
MSRSSLIIGSGACLASIALFAVSFSYRNLGGGQGDPGALFLPRLILALIFAVGAWSFISSFLPESESEPNELADRQDDDIVPGITRKPVLAAIATAIYLVGFRYELYFWATPLYLAYTLWLAGIRRWSTILLIAGGFTLIAYLGFYLLLDVPLLTV